jgi:hypothetical protein
MVAVLLTSSGTGTTPTPILADSAEVGVPAKALEAFPKETRHAAAVADFPRAGERSMKRFIAPISLLLLVALAGCSATPSTVGSSGSPAGTAVTPTVSPTETAVATSPSETTSPSEAPTSPPAAGGTATDFCGAFKELQALNDAPSGDLASMGAQFQAAAAAMRKYAPAEIAKAANTYADVMDNIGKAAAGGSIDQAALQKAISEGMAGNAADIATTAVWVAKNCNL